jgi:hypothetical protein
MGCWLPGSIYLQVFTQTSVPGTLLGTENIGVKKADGVCLGEGDQVTRKQYMDKTLWN